MAVSKLVLTHSKDDTRGDFLDLLGEALYELGLMATPQGWYDSFVSSTYPDRLSDCRVLKLEHVAGAERGTIYVAFFFDERSDPQHLYCTTFPRWDNVTHIGTGRRNFDFVQNYSLIEGTTSFISSYQGIFTLPTSYDTELWVYTGNSGGTRFMMIRGNSYNPILVFSDPNGIQYRPGVDFGDTGVSPVGVMSYYASTAGPVLHNVMMLKSSIFGGFNSRGTASYDFAAGASNTGWEGSSSGVQTRQAVYSRAWNDVLPRIRGDESLGIPNAEDLAIAPGLVVSRDIVYGYPWIENRNLGDLCTIAADATNDFIPAIGDKVIAEAGVEEYEVLGVTSPNEYHWGALAARVV